LASRPIYIALFCGFVSIFACGSETDDIVQAPPAPIAAEICIEGEGKNTQLFIRNLNTYDWDGEIDFVLEKGGLEYKLLGIGRWSRSGKDKPTLWKSEAEQPSLPFTDSGDFVWKDPQWGIDYNRGPEVTRLSFFAGVTGASIKINGTYTADWSTEIVDQC
jgi:hypothetical protein